MCIEITPSSIKFTDTNEHFNLTNAIDFLPDFVRSLSTPEKNLFINKLNLPCDKASLEDMAEQDQDVLMRYIEQFNPGYLTESFESAFNSIKFHQ